MRRTKSEMTRMGLAQWTRRQYWSKETGGVVPVDRLVDRVEATVSVGVRECCCRLGVGEGSFERAAADLSYVGGVKLSAERLRMITEDEGRQVLRWCAEEQMLFDFEGRGQQEPVLPGLPAANPRDKVLVVTDAVEGKVLRAYGSMDGVQTPTITDPEKRERRTKANQRRRRLRWQGLRLRPLPPRRRGTDQRWKEMKVITFYNQGSSWRQVAATMGNHAAAGRLLRAEAAKIGIGSVQQIVAPVDGATYIRRQMERHLPGRTRLVLDFFHLGGHVHETAAEVFGDEDPAGRSWAEGQLHQLRHEEPHRSWQSLLDWRGGLRGPKRRAAADRLLGYVGERREMLRYAECDRHGWDVGSGPMESMCKQLTRRLKGRGMRWDRRNSEAMAALEAIQQSGQWSAYWKRQLDRD